eukprot:8961610-Prorocentrum_lima.AAC.1
MCIRDRNPQILRHVEKVLARPPRIANYGTGPAPTVRKAIGLLAMNAVSAGRVALRHLPAHAINARWLTTPQRWRLPLRAKAMGGRLPPRT